MTRLIFSSIKINLYSSEKGQDDRSTPCNEQMATVMESIFSDLPTFFLVLMSLPGEALVWGIIYLWNSSFIITEK